MRCAHCGGVITVGGCGCSPPNEKAPVGLSPAVRQVHRDELWDLIEGCHSRAQQAYWLVSASGHILENTTYREAVHEVLPKYLECHDERRLGSQGIIRGLDCQAMAIPTRPPMVLFCEGLDLCLQVVSAALAAQLAVNRRRAVFKKPTLVIKTLEKIGKDIKRSKGRFSRKDARRLLAEIIESLPDADLHDFRVKAFSYGSSMQMFVIAHELGHVALGHLENSRRVSHVRSRIQERQADDFAAACLASLPFNELFLGHVFTAIILAWKQSTDSVTTHPAPEERLSNAIRSNPPQAAIAARDHGLSADVLRSMLPPRKSKTVTIFRTLVLGLAIFGAVRSCQQVVKWTSDRAGNGLEVAAIEPHSMDRSAGDDARSPEPPAQDAMDPTPRPVQPPETSGERPRLHAPERTAEPFTIESEPLSPGSPTHIEDVKNDVLSLWNDILAAQCPQKISSPAVALLQESTSTGCGVFDREIRHMYCPSDSTIYVDLNFVNKLGLPSEADARFCQAYVISHNAAHHIEKCLELLPYREEWADYVAGVWFHHASKRFGDKYQVPHESKLRGYLQQANPPANDSRLHGNVKVDDRLANFQRGFSSGNLFVRDGTQ